MYFNFQHEMHLNHLILGDSLINLSLATLESAFNVQALSLISQAPLLLNENNVV